MKSPEIPLAQSIIQQFEQQHIQHIVISPGSRNAPLTLGFAQHPSFTCYSIVDERAAAFFALGMAQQLQQPVAVVCTSGSALLNYYPAVAEAFYSQIPLIVLSADRPSNKIDIGDGQTIRQKNVLKKHTVYNANLTEDANPKNDARIAKAIHKAQTLKGPVHINAPFEEPLYNLLDAYSYQATTPTLKKKKTPKNISEETIKEWYQAERKLILIGTQHPNILSETIQNQLGNDPSVLVLKEITSNVHHPNFIGHIDTLITNFSEQDIIDFQPNIILSIGGMIVSKRIKSLLRTYTQNTQHWHIDPLRAYDTFSLLNKHIKQEPNHFFTTIYEQQKSVHSTYAPKFIKRLKNLLTQYPEFFEKIPFTDLKAFEILSRKIPNNTQLQISNSSAIRYAQLFPFDSSIEVYCNRGTSGIDGSTSTAIGAALHNPKPTTLITGDISFFYDSNALWNNYTPKNLKIILLNNAGGGIFRILPGHQEQEVFHTYFETQHQLNASHLAKMFGWNYLTATNTTELENQLDHLYTTNDQPTLLEIFTPYTTNSDYLKAYFKAMK